MSSFKDLFGIDLDALFVGGDDADNRSKRVKILAVLGRAVLRGSVASIVYQHHADNLLATSSGQLSILMSLYVCNQSLAQFLKCELSARELARLFPLIGKAANEQAYGTLFEALLWATHNQNNDNQKYGGSSSGMRGASDQLASIRTTRRLISFVDENVSSSKKEALLQLDTPLELEKPGAANKQLLAIDQDNAPVELCNSMLQRWPTRLLFPRTVDLVRAKMDASLSVKPLSSPATRAKAKPLHHHTASASLNFAPLTWALLPSSNKSGVTDLLKGVFDDFPAHDNTIDSAGSASDRVLSNHEFNLNDIQPRNVTITNRNTIHNWQGTFCQQCHAMLVVRTVSNRRSSYFVIGPEDCFPQRRLSKWLPEYIRRQSSLLDQTDRVRREELESWLSIDEDLSDIECSRCGRVYDYDTCSNTNKCKIGSCSNRYPCKKTRRLPCKRCFERPF
mmetsp:Transcript_14418/g.24651  ORF Transcript_14418/g.24651 Transcript_14418/m.24651 type:complete len:450 (+) Transcript_14418:75-1424(+)